MYVKISVLGKKHGWPTELMFHVEHINKQLVTNFLKLTIMKIYVVMQHHIVSNTNCISACFTKLENAKKFKDWFSEGDNERIFYIMEKELFDEYIEMQILNEQTKFIR